MILLSAGPPFPNGFAGGGGELGLDVRLREGATFGASLRTVGHSSASFGLARIRAGLHGGYAWRNGAFELLSLAGLSAEPWFVRSSGSTQDLRTSAGSARTGATALGGFVRLVPGYRHKARDRLAVRVGPSIQVSGSSVLAAGGGVARVHDEGSPERDALFRVGGLEFSAGVEFGLWWSARP